MSEETVTEEKVKKLQDIRKEAEEKSCPVQKALYFVEEFLAGPMCGKCYPCALGTNEAKIRLIRLSQHLEGTNEQDIEMIRRIATQMTEASFCKKGKDTGQYLLELLDSSEQEFREHIEGICPKKECTSLLEYVIDPVLCIMCGKCAEVCKYGAIIGEERKPYLAGYLPYEIRQKRCTKCGECFPVCPTNAIEIITIQAEELVDKQ